MYQWLEDYRDLKREQLDVEEKLNRSKTEWKRWLQGDLEYVSLTKGSIAADLEKYIERDTKKLKILKNRIINLNDYLKTVDDLDTQILRLKYIEGKNLYVISEELNYSYSLIKRNHARLANEVGRDLLNEIDLLTKGER